jgi:hypothetical protein
MPNFGYRQRACPTRREDQRREAHAQGPNWLGRSSAGSISVARKSKQLVGVLIERGRLRPHVSGRIIGLVLGGAAVVG